MKKLFAIAACVASLALASINASAAGAFTDTLHVDSLVLPLIGPPPGGNPSGCPIEQIGVVFVSPEGNGVEHITLNGNGGWYTTTYEGDATLYAIAAIIRGAPGTRPTIVPGAEIAQGHLQTWFGVEDNNQNGVFHATLNYNGETPAAGTFGFHANFDVTTNAKGDLTATVANVSCR